MTIVRRSTTKLDGNYLVLHLLEYDDKSCRAQVEYDPGDRPTIVMIQQQPSLELAVAAIARDFSTFAARALAGLPTIGPMPDPDDAEADY